jgi:hypothetical protein
MSVDAIVFDIIISDCLESAMVKIEIVNGKDEGEKIVL